MANNNNNNNSGNYQGLGRGPFWDFVQSFDPNRNHETGAGVDHAHSGPSFGAGFPFGSEGFNPWGGRGSWAGGPWGESPWGQHGRGGRRGRHGHRHRHDDGESETDETAEEGHDYDMAKSPETMRDGHDGPPPPPPAGPPPHHGPPHHGPPPHPSADSPHHGPPPHPHHGPPPHHHGRRHDHHGGPGAFRRGGRCGRGGPRGHHGPPPPPYGGSFDFRPLLNMFGAHPLAQAFRNNADQARSGAQEAAGEQPADQDNTFVPPVDVFNTEKAYILHVSLPGAVKEDVGVNWDSDKSVLNVAGVVYRPGNEEFLQTLASSERKVGMFERSIKLPPSESNDKEEVDGFSITAKMENGILIVTVPKAEKEWTEIHKIDIE